MIRLKATLLLALALCLWPKEAFSSDTQFLSHDINVPAWYDYYNLGAYPYVKMGFGTSGTFFSVSSSNPLPVGQGTSPWVTSRNWTLSNSTDSVTAYQGDTWTVQQGTPPWSVSQSTVPWIVSGQSAVGSPPSNNPVPISGVDGGGLKRAFITDTTGNMNVVGSVGSGSSDSGNPVKMGAKYNSALPSFTNGQRADLQVNAFGELSARTRNKYLNMVGIVTTTVKSGAGVLHTICFNNGANGSTLTIYDNTAASGTKIGTPALLAANTNVLNCLNYDAEFSTGLTIVSAGSAANDITVTYQ